MTTIKATSKRGQDFINSARRIDGYELFDVYGKPSNAKRSAYRFCRELCLAENGTGFRIISHNTFGFSVAWFTEQGLRIETPKNSYLIA